MRRFLPIICASVLISCSAIVPPTLDNFYGYAYFITGKTAIADTLIFHWPRELLPVKVWVASGDSLAPHVATAIARWQSAFMYGEFQATMVSDSSAADIIVYHDIPPEDNGVGVAAFASECSGQTDLDTASTALTLQLPVHIYVWANDLIPAATLETCYRVTTTHEFGHAIGLLVHSGDSGDVMYSNPVFDGISERDRETAELVYHIPPTVVVVPRH